MRGGEDERTAYLSPESKIPILQEHHTEPSQRNSRPHITQTIWRPVNRSIHQDHRMDLSQPRQFRQFLLRVKDDEWEDEADRESNKHSSILTILAEHLVRAESTPEHRCGEERVDARTGELVGLVRRAHVGDLIDLEVQDADTDEGRDESGDHLCEEGVTGWDLDVVREFHVVGETHCVGAGHVSVALEVVHGKCVSCDPGAANEFSEHVERYFDSGHGCD